MLSFLPCRATGCCLQADHCSDVGIKNHGKQLLTEVIGLRNALKRFFPGLGTGRCRCSGLLLHDRLHDNSKFGHTTRRVAVCDCWQQHSLPGQRLCPLGDKHPGQHDTFKTCKWSGSHKDALLEGLSKPRRLDCSCVHVHVQQPGCWTRETDKRKTVQKKTNCLVRNCCVTHSAYFFFKSQ